MKDVSTLIPPGKYCYRVRACAPGEPRLKVDDRYGKDQRETSFHEGYVQVLCPFWLRTEYGMVRCQHLNIEGLDEAEGAREKALAHFGSPEALDLANKSPHFLPDEIKICQIREDEDEDWACVAPAT